VKLPPVAVTVGVAGLTVRLPVALLGAYEASPEKLAEMLFVYVPAARPTKLTLVTVATPDALVVAVKLEPLMLKLTALPATAVAPLLRVAMRVVVPP
jgi:hypothetical protein